ncbi:MAG: DUF3794 domain-containing protein [Limnochordales bacterium]|nr:hypothetical protein [Bacillota bacterium]REJ32229.1 MAG: hypothetical protein DIU83_09115 [Bacillota bacterium]
MNVSLRQQTVRMARLVGTATQQAVAEATLELPGGLPEMSRVVRVIAHPVVTGWEAAENELIVQGAVDFTVLYAHERPEPPAARDIEAERGYDAEAANGREPLAAFERREELYRHRWRRAAKFEVILDVPGAGPGVAADVEVRPEEMDVQLHHTGRRLDVEAVVALTARVKQLYDAQVPVWDGPPDDAQADVQLVAVRNEAGRRQAHVSVDGALPADGEVPLARVVDVSAAARARAEEEDGRLVVQGTMDYRVLAVDENGRLTTRTWHDQTPFRYVFDAAGVQAEDARVRAVVTGVDAAVRGGLAVEVFADVALELDASSVRRLPLLVGLAAPEGLEVRSRTSVFGLEEWVGQGTADERLRETLELPAGHPPIDRVIFAEAAAAVDDVLVLGDKVVGEGYVTVAALYVARTEGQPLHYVSWRRAMAFESEIDVPGAQPGMDADVSARVASIAVDLLNRETVEADVRLTFEAAVTRPVEREAIVEAVAVPPPEENPPTFTFVAVQPGDTLWKLSNRYHANMDDIVRANPWLQGAADGPLPAGRKLCVPRRRPQAAP